MCFSSILSNELNEVEVIRYELCVQKSINDLVNIFPHYFDIRQSEQLQLNTFLLQIIYEQSHVHCEVYQNFKEIWVLNFLQQAFDKRPWHVANYHFVHLEETTYNVEHDIVKFLDTVFWAMMLPFV